MRSRGERISITSWGMPDNGRASDGSLTVRLKRRGTTYPSRYISIGWERLSSRIAPGVHTTGLKVNDHYEYITRTFTLAILAARNGRENIYQSIASTMTVRKFSPADASIFRTIAVHYLRLFHSSRRIDSNVFESLTIYGLLKQIRWNIERYVARY